MNAAPTGPDLFDFLALEDDVVVHCILPNMALACGADLLAALGLQRVDHHPRTTTTTHQTTCPDCLAIGDLRAISQAMNGRQATEI